jgi:hypothetical protein
MVDLNKILNLYLNNEFFRDYFEMHPLWRDLDGNYLESTEALKRLLKKLRNDQFYIPDEKEKSKPDSIEIFVGNLDKYNQAESMTVLNKIYTDYTQSLSFSLRFVQATQKFAT